MAKEIVFDVEARDRIAEAGGISRLAGGGMVGIRKPNAIPPERQGLRSIMINGKKS